MTVHCIVPILHLRKVRLRRYSSIQRQSWDLNPGLSGSKAGVPFGMLVGASLSQMTVACENGLAMVARVLFCNEGREQWEVGAVLMFPRCFLTLSLERCVFAPDPHHPQ